MWQEVTSFRPHFLAPSKKNSELGYVFAHYESKEKIFLYLQWRWWSYTLQEGWKSSWNSSAFLHFTTQQIVLYIITLLVSFLWIWCYIAKWSEAKWWSNNKGWSWSWNYNSFRFCTTCLLDLFNTINCILWNWMSEMVQSPGKNIWLKWMK